MCCSAGWRAPTRTTGRRSGRSARRSGGPSKRRDPRRPRGRDHRGGRPVRRGGRVRRTVQRHGGGSADGLVRRAAGHVPEHRGARGGPPARQPVLGLAVHRAGGDLPAAQRHRRPHGPHGRRRAAHGLPGRVRVLFTADPVTGNRRTATVDAGFGLGEALVSGLVNPDVFRVRDGEVVARAIAVKERAVHALPGGGTRGGDGRTGAAGATGADRCAGRGARAARAADRGPLRASAGHRVVPDRRRVPDRAEPADHDAVPRPRPRTPSGGCGGRPGPERLRLRRPSADDDRRHETSLGWSLWQRTAMVPMHEAGGRLFVDVTPRLARAASRAALLDVMGKGDPLVRDALETVLERAEFALPVPDAGLVGPPAGGAPGASVTGASVTEADPAVVAELVERSETSSPPWNATSGRRADRRCSTSLLTPSRSTSACSATR